MPAKRLSKSQFMMGLQCLKRLWFYNYRKDLIPPIAPAQQQIFDQGHAIGELARQYFPGGVLVEADHMHIPDAIKHTAELVAGKTRVIYEATFVFDDVLVRTDILKKNKDGSWDLIEVKGSTEVKDEHLYDVSVQRYVLEGAGLKIRKAELMHIDNTFVKDGEIKPKDFFRRQDITEETAELLPEIKEHLKTFMKALASAKEPQVEIGRHCSSPYQCDFCGHCWKHVPEYSIYDIPRLSWEKKEALREMGILKFRDVPEDFDLNDGQRLYWQVERTGRTILDKERIKEFLARLQYPICHIDFETIMPGLPLYDGTRPYQQIPFQVSLHIQAKPGAKPVHCEFLADGKRDPRAAMAQFLVSNIGPKGTLLAYNASFEAKRIEELAEAFPRHKKALVSFLERIVDLMKPFQQRAYLHPKFKGRYSIKNVLPALIPDMTYKGMTVANGGDAQIAYLNILSGKLSPEAVAQTRKDLIAYCGQDTLAMVKILEHLGDVA